jgi:hypothetical protein
LNPVEQVERFHTELHASACSNAHQAYWETTLRYKRKNPNRISYNFYSG